MPKLDQAILPRYNAGKLVLHLIGGEEYAEIRIRGLSPLGILTITLFSPDAKKIGETQKGKEIIPAFPLPDNHLGHWRGRPPILPFLINGSCTRKDPGWSFERFLLKRQLLLVIWRG
ncbi:hypothetical protein AVEN_128153-1 [Araneus ventricosus]|uniref:Uncharacterized protein n=1 Tax=Araneus ventricosus TaxID=182803 RepID=A0A4Y2A1T8_ARAVE|nr:hypothetical protein AVEN_128153-1 [Araneus ventricosus]